MKHLDFDLLLVGTRHSLAIRIKAASPARVPELKLMMTETPIENENKIAPTLVARLKTGLGEIFEGREDYLGLTPD